MRNLFLLLIFLCAVQLYSQGADYPQIMNNGTIFINTGVGFGNKIETEKKCPPLSVSMDIAIPIMGFPVTLGLIAGYFTESDSSIDLSAILAAGRIAYHLNLFNLPRLDTYVLLTLGEIFTEVNSIKGNDFWFGLCAGVRYFFLPNIGAFSELGFDNAQFLSVGLSFKL